MKRRIALLLLAVTMLAACGAAPATEEETGRSPESAVTEQVQTVAEKTPQPPAAPAATQTPAPPPEPSPMPTAAPTATPEPVVTPTPTAAPTEAPVQQTSVSMSYGGVSFELAAGTEQWWSIDSSDSAYWAVLENINAMRAAGGLAALTMDAGLSAAADSRCESFVAGGPFDHSGMTTRSEICAAGPIGSASSVCSYWQNSPAHYNNIMSSSFTGMGVACWFCSTAEGQYTYWVVTFN